MGLVLGSIGLFFVATLVYGLVAMGKHIKDYINREQIKNDQTIQVMPKAYEGKTGAQATSFVTGIIILTSLLILLVTFSGFTAARALIPLLLLAWVVLPIVLIIANVPIIWNKAYIRAELYALDNKNRYVLVQKIVSWVTWSLGELAGIAVIATVLLNL